MQATGWEFGGELPPQDRATADREAHLAKQAEAQRTVKETDLVAAVKSILDRK